MIYRTRLGSPGGRLQAVMEARWRVAEGSQRNRRTPALTASSRQNEPSPGTNFLAFGQLTYVSQVCHALRHVLV
jgi:hypothetical protein